MTHRLASFSSYSMNILPQRIRLYDTKEMARGLESIIQCCMLKLLKFISLWQKIIGQLW